MLRKIKITASFQGVLPVASYANVRPAFGAEEEFEIETETTKDVDEIIETRHKELQSICSRSFEQEAVKAKVQKITADRKDFRFYKLPSGEEVPSVTSIINYDSEFLVDSEELKQYASQGNLIHAQVAEFIKTGEWKNPKDIEGTTADLFIIKKGSLGLSLDGWDFPSFLKKYQITKMENGVPVLNEEHKYGGLPDLIGIYEGKKTLCDVKRTPDKVKNFIQMSAYAKCLSGIEQLMIIPLNDRTEQGFSKPMLTSDIEKYFELFLYKRREFKKVYDL